MYISEKTIIRIVSFVAAGVIALIGVIIKEGAGLAEFRTQQQNTYLRSLREMSTRLGAVAVGLEKTGYAGTPAQVTALSAQIWKDAGGAKSAMSGLPATDQSLDSAYRFLSQAGDYAMYLSNKSVTGQEITAEERADFRRLAEYAESLSRRIAEMEIAASSGAAGAGNLLYLGDGFEDYPILTYDGQFSVNAMETKAEMLEGQRTVSANEARETAVRFTGVPGLLLEPGAEERSIMPSYTFHGGMVDVAVTKNGGFVTYFLNSRPIGDKTVTAAAARRKAEEYLSENSSMSMIETGYEVDDGICTVNFACTQDGVTIHNDRIKVSVALDDGRVVSYDARDFIANHRNRNLGSPTLTATEARAFLGEGLSVKQTGLSIIPTGSGKEVLAYEFHCRGGNPADSKDVLVYVNAHTGVEEKILILAKDENGILSAYSERT